MGARLAPTVAVTVALATAAVLTLLGLVLLVNHPAAIPCLPLTQNQDAETLLYLSVYLVVLPMAVLIGPRLTDLIAAGPNRASLPALSGLLIAALAMGIIGLKVSPVPPWLAGGGGALAIGALWWIGAVLVIWRATRPQPWRVLAWLSGATAPLWIVTGLLTFGVILCFANLTVISPSAIPLGAVVIGGGVVVLERGGTGTLGQPWRLSADLVLVTLVFLAVPDLIVVQPELAAGSSPLSNETSIIQFHQNFLLGPANEILAGGVMLQDTASQYGVALIYLLAGWFSLVPIGYGTFGLFSGVANAVSFAAGYGLLRIAGVPRRIAACTFLVAVITLVFDTTYPLNAIPQDSAVRFGFPLALLVPLVAVQRWPRAEGHAWRAVVLLAGLSSIWSLEACVYSLATLAPMMALAAWLRPSGDRFRWLVAQTFAVAVACVATHLLFAGLTWVASGRLPDWGQYLAYLRAFLFEPLGDLNFDFVAWSPGLLVGALYVISAIGLVLLILRRPEFVNATPTTTMALTGITAYGVAIFSYYNNRSTDFVLAGVALPAFLITAIWLSLCLRGGLVPRAVARGALVGALATAVLLVAVGWTAIAQRYPQSALGHVVPGGASTRDAITRLWNLPPLHPAAAEGQRLLETFLPDPRRSLVLATPDLQVEILMRSRRGNAIPLAAPWQDTFIAPQRLPGLERAIEALQGGERMLISDSARAAFATLRAHPALDPLVNTCGADTPPPSLGDMTPLQSWVLKRLGERFDLTTVHVGNGGLSIVELSLRQ